MLALTIPRQYDRDPTKGTQRDVEVEGENEFDDYITLRQCLRKIWWLLVLNLYSIFTFIFLLLKPT